MASSSPDIIHQVTGDFGRWQLRTVLLVFFCKIPSAWFMACIIYTAPYPKIGDYYCKPPLGINDTKEWIKKSHPIVEEAPSDRLFNIDFCNVYADALQKDFSKTYSTYMDPFQEPHNVTAGNIIPCEKFKHNSDYHSLITQFDLVCSRQLLLCVTQSFHAIGTLIGGFMATKFLEHVSPRRLMLIGMICQIVCGNLTGLVPSFPLHIYFRCLTSLFCAFMYTSGQMILADITNGKAKLIVTTLFELFWSIGLILLPGISIFVDDWSYLYIVISSSTIILVILHRYITESPRWLIGKGKVDQTLRVLLEAAAFNNHDIPFDCEERLAELYITQKDKKTDNYWSIWDGTTKKSYIVSVHLAWVWCVILYNAMILNIRAFGVDHLHVNTAVMGLTEMVGVFLGLYLILYTRRRWLWVGYLMIGAGLLTFFIWFVPDTIKEVKRVGFDMIFCIGLKLANATSLSVLTTCTGEMVPLNKRPILMFSVITFSRIWLAIAPFVLASAILHPLIPITLFAFFAVLNGGSMCYLNTKFWNETTPRIERVPSVRTYRRKSSILLMKRNSTCSELEIDNLGMTFNISDIWKISENVNNEMDDSSSDFIEMK